MASSRRETSANEARAPCGMLARLALSLARGQFVGPRLDPPGTNHRRKRDGDVARQDFGLKAWAARSRLVTLCEAHNLALKRRAMLLETVTTSDLARLFNVTPKTIAEWVKSGLLTRPAQGQFDLVASVRSFVRHMWDRDGGSHSGVHFTVMVIFLDITGGLNG